MKVSVLASLAMSCALAITPFAVVDSFGSSRIGAHTVSNFKSISSLRSLRSLSRPVVQAATVQPNQEAQSDTSDLPDAKAKAGAPSNGSYLMAENAGDEGVANAFSRRAPAMEKSAARSAAVMPRSAISLTGLVTMLADAPESGSLFLLGTGLLGAALALFWKSAKSSRS